MTTKLDIGAYTEVKSEPIVQWDEMPKTITASTSIYTTRRISVGEQEPEVKAGYMVSVDGAAAPEKVHASLEDAKQEAERISKSQNGKTIRVLLLVGIYEPSHTWKEMV